MLEKVAFNNKDVKSMNSPLIILSLSHDGTADCDTGGFWIALNNGSVVLVYILSVLLVCGLSAVLVCGLSVMVVARRALIGGLSETSQNISAEILSGMETSGWGLLVSVFPLREIVRSWITLDSCNINCY